MTNAHNKPTLPKSSQVASNTRYLVPFHILSKCVHIWSFSKQTNFPIFKCSSHCYHWYILSGVNVMLYLQCIWYLWLAVPSLMTSSSFSRSYQVGSYLIIVRIESLLQRTINWINVSVVSAKNMWNLISDKLSGRHMRLIILVAHVNLPSFWSSFDPSQLTVVA